VLSASVSLQYIYCVNWLICWFWSSLVLIFGFEAVYASWLVYTCRNVWGNSSRCPLLIFWLFYDNRLLFIWHLLRRFVDRQQWNECQLGWCEHRRGLQTGQDLQLWVNSLQMTRQKKKKIFDWHLVIKLQVREAEKTTDRHQTHTVDMLPYIKIFEPQLWLEILITQSTSHRWSN